MVPWRLSALTPDDIRRACEGDRRAMAALVDALLPIVKVEAAVSIRRRASAKKRDPRQEVDDLVQGVFEFLLKNRGAVLLKWDPQRGRSLASFVRLLTNRHIARVYIGGRGNPWALDPTEDAALESLRHDHGGAQRRAEFRAYLLQVLDIVKARLNERGLVLFDLIYVQERPVAEICETMSMTRAAVDQWKSRFRRQVRGLVDKESS